MSDVKFMSVEELKQRLSENPELMVVNTYMMEEGFRQKRIEPAMPMYDFVKMVDNLPKDREIVFY